MKPQITVITLAVEDLERAVASNRYELRLQTERIIGTECTQGCNVSSVLEVDAVYGEGEKTRLA